MRWSRRHILDTDDWSTEEIEAVLDTTGAMVEVLSRPVRRAPPLRGRTVVLFFAESSTRTRVSFELAARTDINALVPLGATITLSGPPTLMPSAWRCGQAPAGTTYEMDLDRALDGADAVIALRLQKERQEGGLLPSLREYTRVWGLTEARVSLMRPGAPVMHPGPMNEGVEIDAAVAHGARSLVGRPVAHGVAARMALLYLLVGTPTLEAS